MRGTAAVFLLDPARNVGGDVLDCDVPRSCGTEKDHRVAVDKGDIRQVQRDFAGGRVFRLQSLLQLRNVFAGELSTQVDPEGFVVFPDRRDLQHGFLTPTEFLCTSAAIIHHP